MSLQAWSSIPAMWSNWVKKHCVLIVCKKMHCNKNRHQAQRRAYHAYDFDYLLSRKEKKTIGLHAVIWQFPDTLVKLAYISKMFRKCLSLFLIFSDVQCTQWNVFARRQLDEPLSEGTIF